MATQARGSSVAASTLLAFSIALAPTAIHGTSAQPADSPIASTRFTGKDRAQAKTSIVVDHDVEEFASVKDLVARLPKDSAMRHHDPAIEKRGTHARRVAEEKDDVRLHALLYAARLEDDGDFHLIVGDDGANPEYFNCEVSGLPAKSSRYFSRLRDARREFLDLLSDADEAIPGDDYKHFDPPLRIVVEGSLFFDVDHGAGQVGPLTPIRRRPKTAWEIHPVTSIEDAGT